MTATDQDAVRGAYAVLTRVPVVDYLRLDPPRLRASGCRQCAARFFDRRNACASCGAAGDVFDPVDVSTTGTVRSFTVVAFAGAGITVPFVAAVVDCDGTSVRTNLVNVTAHQDHVWLGMAVRLATFSLGIDGSGVEAIGFGFEPATSSAATSSAAISSTTRTS